MITVLRIVRLSFVPENIAAFEQIFRDAQPLIASFDGCLGVEVKRDFEQHNVYYTVSRWRSHADLQNYRQSELFRTTWAKTKVLFDEKPKAFSLCDLV